MAGGDGELVVGSEAKLPRGKTMLARTQKSGAPTVGTARMRVKRSEKPTVQNTKLHRGRAHHLAMQLPAGRKFARMCRAASGEVS
jgi:hypothetical protein